MPEKPPAPSIDTTPPRRVEVARPEPPPPPAASEFARPEPKPEVKPEAKAEPKPPVPKPHEPKPPKPIAWPPSRLDQVKLIQSVLRELHFYNGQPDGKLSPATRTAIRDYERTAGLKETGEPSKALFESLKDMRTLMAPKN